MDDSDDMDKLLAEVKAMVKARFNSVCPRCGALFNCGMKSNKARCWCFDEVAGRNMGCCPPGECLCKTCLTEK